MNKTLSMTFAAAMTILLPAWQPAAHAEMVLVDGKVQVARTDVPRPKGGMTMAAVEAHFGTPRERHPTVGTPPITRWDYEGFSVFFEKDRVIDAVVPAGASASAAVPVSAAPEGSDSSGSGSTSPAPASPAPPSSAAPPTPPASPGLINIDSGTATSLTDSTTVPAPTASSSTDAAAPTPAAHSASGADAQSSAAPAAQRPPAGAPAASVHSTH